MERKLFDGWAAKEWFPACFAMVLLLLAVGLVFDSFDPTVQWEWFALWSQIFVGLASLVIAYVTLRHRSPKTVVPRLIRSIPLVVLGGFAMPAYNAVKTLINERPLWADPLLAQIDLALFGWLYFDAPSIFGNIYHIGWFAGVCGTLMAVGMRKASNKRTNLIIAYFFLWCVISPLVQLAIPAGGPIFYERLGYGSLFASRTYPQVVSVLADYLWAHYTAGAQGLSSGISAMPSLHIASSAWVALAWHRTMLFLPAVLFCVGMFLLSIGLGWHYAIDGIVGALLAIFSFWIARFVNRWMEPQTSPSNRI
ncbi:phosphatase PAP2 family protein [Sphingomicrobium clamense]|uniref:Phosphatase PAP2 family protein n=1 Tax=Sphingomicrobium clamense TaxID=2851013 RepID=A0ABS6V8I5_9SPHN|nr:phosphatase PAP2 family protein [Sphingomicrobium sp. B8]MBW0145462.1 phosphatase PAP2 family protein [Sphingomicrobium sp. B8]